MSVLLEVCKGSNATLIDWHIFYTYDIKKEDETFPQNCKKILSDQIEIKIFDQDMKSIK